MTVIAWRLVARKYSDPPHNPFDGEGARLYGGRWNSKGTAVVYASSARSLAILETLVHAGNLSALLDHVIYPITFADDLVEVVDPATLPADWAEPVAPPALQRIGDGWVGRASSPVLRIPSVVVSGESNFLLNPNHPLFGQLVIGPRGPLPLDPRLIPKP